MLSVSFIQLFVFICQCLVNSIELEHLTNSPPTKPIRIPTSKQWNNFKSTSSSNLHNVNHQWIIHMHGECTHNEITQYLNHYDIKILHQHSILLHGVSISGLKQSDELYQDINKHLNNIVILDRKHMISKCVKRIVPNNIKKIAIVNDYISNRGDAKEEKGEFHKEISRKPFYSWGTDRLDQEDLPLNEQYQPTYNGSGVDVYVIDTGIDTKHCEFGTAGGGTACHSVYDSVRTVRNIYDSFGAHTKAITRYIDQIQNVDDVGHGSHVSGTIGGIHVGVAPGSNLYGVKVLNSHGEGTTGDTVAGLEYVVQFARNKARAGNSSPSVVSMSLGGPCDIPNDCADDTLALAVESMITAHGFIVSVAAGNEGCNACSGSPNAAPSAIRAGAMDDTDSVPYFSNYGACVSVFAPGVDITSACSSLLCPNSENDYSTKSGTSMACPHVSGVIAQLVQKSSAPRGGSVISQLTSALIIKALICNAAKGKLQLDSLDTVSRDLILQVASAQSGSSENGGIVEQQCTSALSACSHLLCSNQGVCLPTRSEKQLQTPYSVFYDGLTLMPPGGQSQNYQIPSSCHCNYGYFGAHCQFKTSDTTRDSADGSKIYLSCPTGSDLSLLFFRLFDVTGDGWKFAKYAMVEADNSSSTRMYSVINDAYDSLCFGQKEMRYYCVRDTMMHLEVSAGLEPHAIEWEMCGYFGGAPFHGLFGISGVSVDADGTDDDQVSIDVSTCELTCNKGHKTVVSLGRVQDHSEGGGLGIGSGGWEGAYYAVLSIDGRHRLAGGTLSTGFERNHTLCLPVGEYIFLFDHESATLAQSKIMSEICEVLMFGTQNSVHVMIDDKYNCVGTFIPSSSSDLVPVEREHGGVSTCGSRKGKITSTPFFMYDDILSDRGTRNASMLLELTKIGGFSSGDSSDVVLREVLDFGMKGDICLQDGCYNMDLEQYVVYDALAGRVGTGVGNNPVWNSTLGISWNICGFKSGSIPFHGHVCVERDYNMCYGLTGCPILKTYVPSSDKSLAIFTSSIPDPLVATNQLHFIKDAVSLHGVSELCELEDGCYDVFLGGGERNYQNSTKQFHLCGVRSNLPASLNVCISDKGSKCDVSNIIHKHCHAMSLISNVSSPTFEHSFIKIDTYGDGWGASRYKIRTLPTGNESSRASSSVSYEGKKIADGTLSDGGYGIDHLCLMESCYTLYISPSESSNEIAWLFCGHIGNAADALYDQHLHFCVDKHGNCHFLEDGSESESISNPNLDTVTDDDFPHLDGNGSLVTITPLPTYAPSATPTATPTVVPTHRASSYPSVIPTLVLTPVPTYSPTVSATENSSAVAGGNDTDTATSTPTVTATLALATVHISMDMKSIDANANTNAVGSPLDEDLLVTSVGFTVERILRTAIANYTLSKHTSAPIELWDIQVGILRTTTINRTSEELTPDIPHNESESESHIHMGMHAVSINKLKLLVPAASTVIPGMTNTKTSGSSSSSSSSGSRRLTVVDTNTYHCSIAITLVSGVSTDLDGVVLNPVSISIPTDNNALTTAPTNMTITATSIVTNTNNHSERLDGLVQQQHVVANIMQYAFHNHDYENLFDRVYYYIDRDGNAIELFNFRYDLSNNTSVFDVFGNNSNNSGSNDSSNIRLMNISRHLPSDDSSLVDYNEIHFPPLRGAYIPIITSSLALEDADNNNNDGNKSRYTLHSIWLYVATHRLTQEIIGICMCLMIFMCWCICLFYRIPGTRPGYRKIKQLPECEMIDVNANNRNDTVNSCSSSSSGGGSGITDSNSGFDIESESEFLREGHRNRTCNEVGKTETRGDGDPCAYTYNLLRRGGEVELQNLGELVGDIESVKNTSAYNNMHMQDETKGNGMDIYAKGHEDLIGSGNSFVGIKDKLSTVAINTISKQNQYDRVADADIDDEI